MSNNEPKIKMLEVCNALSIHDNTSIFHEAEFNNYAPHHYMVVDKQTLSEDRNNAAPTILGAIDFQNGPVKENGVNGVTEENLLAIVANRLENFQSSDFACKENHLALIHIEEAIMWLKKRTAEREIRGVEGTNEV